MNVRPVFLVALIIILAAVRWANAKLVTYSAPSEAPGNGAYVVDVREGSGNWKPLFVYDAVVGKEGVHHTGFVMFDSDFTEGVEIRIRPDRAIERVRVRPKTAVAEVRHQPSETVIHVAGPGQFSVEFDEKIFSNLVVFASPLESDPISADRPGITYFGPGEHWIGGDGQGTIPVEAGSTIYLAGGSVVYGKIDTGGKDGITIRGRGILCGSKFDHAPDSDRPTMIYIGNATDVLIEGIVLLDAPAWNMHLHHVRNTVVRNVKVLAWMTETDGINPRGSQDLLIEDSFVRNGDDCISVKLGDAKNPDGVTQRNRNILVRNCVLWPDRAHALLIGPEGASGDPAEHLTENVQFRDIDILRSAESDPEFLGALAIMASDRQTIRDILFQDIRVSPLDAGNLIDIRFANNIYTKDFGERIENVRFKDIRLEGPNQLPNRILGLNADRVVSGVTFDGLWIDGQHVLSREDGDFEINAFVEDLEFR